MCKSLVPTLTLIIIFAQGSMPLGLEKSNIPLTLLPVLRESRESPSEDDPLWSSSELTSVLSAALDLSPRPSVVVPSSASSSSSSFFSSPLRRVCACAAGSGSCSSPAHAQITTTLTFYTKTFRASRNVLRALTVYRPRPNGKQVTMCDQIENLITSCQQKCWL